MAKDPAVLFYTSDFLSGTFTMSNEQVGKYIRLLCLQHQKGVLSEKDMLSICLAYDDDIWSKFIKTENGYINQKMNDETVRRQKFSESRRNNAKTPKNDSTSKAYASAYAKHMETETETETVTITDTKTKTEKKAKSQKPKSEILLPWSSENFMQHWDHWKEYKSKEHKFNFKSAQSEQATLNELSSLSNGHEDTACKIILQSMSKGWKGLFELKTQTDANTKTQQSRTSPKITDRELYEAFTKRSNDWQHRTGAQ